MVTYIDDTTTPLMGPDELQGLLTAANEATALLATARVVPAEVARLVERLSRTLRVLSPLHFGDADPYLVESLLLGTIVAVDALHLADRTERRRQLRVGLEQVRQSLRDLVAERDTGADRPAKDVARWLVTTTGLPQAEVAELVGVSHRTFQRWASATEPTEPSGADELALRTLARAVDQLRWSMTPPGVVAWLRRPHPTLDGGRPADLLGHPGGYGRLRHLAAGTRAMVAS